MTYLFLTRASAAAPLRIREVPADADAEAAFQQLSRLVKNREYHGACMILACDGQVVAQCGVEPDTARRLVARTLAEEERRAARRLVEEK